MSLTFSINIGQLTEATRKTDIFSVLNDIQDNTQKLIEPRDVRDAILSTWANSPFKVTTNQSLNEQYIGIDSSNPANRDIKQKILLGKRNFGGLDIMTPNLLNSDTDIFLFNTKLDSAEQSSTRLSILAGTNSNLYSSAPYIESSVNNDESAINLNIVNPATNGGLNLLSLSGRVAINGIIFPTIAETENDALNGMILRYRGTYPNGYFKWEQPTTTTNTIGTLGFPTNIYGSTVSVNNYPLEFIDNNFTTATLGGVVMGSSFSANSFNNGISFQNWPLTEVLRKILYPYIAPVVQMTGINILTNSIYAEVGTTASIKLNYSITTYTRSKQETIKYRISGATGLISNPGITYSAGLPGNTITGSHSENFRRNSTGQKTYIFEVEDFNENSLLYTATASISFINPVYYGFTSSVLTSIDANQYPIYSSLAEGDGPFFSGYRVIQGINVWANTGGPFGGSGELGFVIDSNTLGGTFEFEGDTYNIWELVPFTTYTLLNKSITPYPGLSNSISFNYNGSGYLYLAYPNSFATRISQIQDPNGFIIYDKDYPQYSAFTFSTQGQYQVLRTNLPCAFPGPELTQNSNFKFIF